ncbi:hypothetical protein [Kitasatospora sp. McL0602]|uniref:hypothetical protein n=1 Tax=Kitasatospora sp. McL0602 TaxID=3439530 RepID=UPI003F8A06AB
MQPETTAEQDDRWWAPGLISTALLPVWCVGFMIVNAIATLAKFGDTGCDDGSGGCMGPGHGTKVLVFAIVGTAALISLATWLMPRRKQLRALRWLLTWTSLLLGLGIQFIAASSPSH